MDKMLDVSGTPTATRAKPGLKAAIADPEALAITFPQGLIGCPDWQQFHLWPVPFVSCGELISTDQDGVGLLVADPAMLGIRYQLELDEDDVEVLQLTAAEDARLLCILTVQREPLALTANLAGPLVINQEAGLGKQVVFDHQQYPLRAPLLMGEEARAFIDAVTLRTDHDNAPRQTPATGSGEGA